MTVSLSVATLQDAKAVLSLMEAQLADHDLPFDRRRLSAAIRGVLADNGLGVIVLARVGKASVGLAFLGYFWSLEHGGLTSWLDELYVAPDHRNAGIGSLLLRHACQHARRKGCRAVDLEVVAGHERANRLYRRFGFKPLNRKRWVLRLRRSTRSH
jgi:GNAT superfamily N-acetyltransferase